MSSIAMLGGTGPEGRGLAARFLANGETVWIGSRVAERATETVDSLRELVPNGKVFGGTNAEAAEQCEVVMISVPYSGLDGTIESCGDALEGKVILDLVVPIRVDAGVFQLETVPEGSAAERIQARVPGARVVSGLKHQSATDLLAIGKELEGDVLLCSDDPEARELIAGFIRGVPMLRPVDAGSLRVARHLDAVTALILNLNRRHKSRASVQVIGLEAVR